MINYFSKYPKIEYKFYNNTTQTLVDINIKYTISDVAKSKSQVFYPFQWRDGDKLGSLANSYYDSVKYYWLVLQSNDIFNPYFDLPLTDEIFMDYLVNKYKVEALNNGYTENINSILEYCFQTIHHYEDKDGFIIDLNSFVTLGDTSSISIYDYEFQLNEDKRSIRLIENSKKTAIENELDDKLRTLKAELGQ